MPLIVVTPPAVEPVSLAEARLWCRVDDGDTAQDSVISMLIKAMREYAENLTGRAFVQRTLQLNLDCLPGCIALPMPPLVSVASVIYTDLDGALQTLAAADYQVDDVAEPGKIVPAWDAAAWPAVRAVPNAVRVLYVAGYDEGSGSPTDYTANMPAALKLWMSARISTMFENREQLVNANQVAIPRHFADGYLDELIIGARLF